MLTIPQCSLQYLQSTHATLQEASEISTLGRALGQMIYGFYSKNHGGEL